MNSIKTKLFINISILVILFVAFTGLISSLFLEKMYIWQKKQSIVEKATIIADDYNTAAKDISSTLEQLANNLGAIIFISGQDGYIKYSSVEYFGKAPTNRPLTEPPQPPFTLKSKETLGNSAILEIRQDKRFNISFMVYKQSLKNNDSLTIRLPLAPVAESAAYASKFMAIIGMISILAGCTWAYFFAKRFTSPLLELGQVTKSISQLDFSQKCNIIGNNELSDLGKNINNLSHRLHKAIDELNQKNLQLLADVEQSRQLDKLRKDFISSVSHELKTPISLILGYAEGLKENVNQDEDNKNYYCSVIIDEAEKMDKLVKDLLNLSQIESGFYVLEKTDFDFAALLDDIVSKYHSILLEKNITLTVEKLPYVIVNADSLRIGQLLVNFLNNAIDHAENEKLIKITVDSSDSGKKVKVSIFNTGKHVPAESLDNLWLSFYKVDKARTRDLGGYGLGLSIVRAIQELHGNSYGVNNIAGGVLFWFTIDKA